MDGGLEWSLVGECGSECVCLSKEKRKKMKRRNEMAEHERVRWIELSGGLWG